jgi:hypothetical protein
MDSLGVDEIAKDRVVMTQECSALASAGVWDGLV